MYYYVKKKTVSNEYLLIISIQRKIQPFFLITIPVSFLFLFHMVKSSRQYVMFNVMDMDTSDTSIEVSKSIFR